jgi:hypothetical protein
MKGKQGEREHNLRARKVGNDQDRQEEEEVRWRAAI